MTQRHFPGTRIVLTAGLVPRWTYAVAGSSVHQTSAGSRRDGSESQSADSAVPVSDAGHVPLSGHCQITVTITVPATISAPGLSRWSPPPHSSQTTSVQRRFTPPQPLAVLRSLVAAARAVSRGGCRPPTPGGPAVDLDPHRLIVTVYANTTSPMRPRLLRKSGACIRLCPPPRKKVELRR